MTTKGVPYSWEISQPDGNDEGTDISRYSSLGAPAHYTVPRYIFIYYIIMFSNVFNITYHNVLSYI